ncbi:hypothetical protein AOQ84DRAFT_172537 [Glonium stellatum]|uniref:Uncharacterized protein n=1 Tax=Glonium stellatum TaxID=574774 RepID=A0A8E2JW74_9PEZI|nr:hypothetical protein AOQ84DRAFT_172537 [Glonium stellatum]
MSIAVATSSVIDIQGLSIIPYFHSNCFACRVKRQSGSYMPSTSQCGPGSTCAKACGTSFIACPGHDGSRCFNPINGDSCCSDGTGNSCSSGHYCAWDLDYNTTVCCPNGVNLADCDGRGDRLAVEPPISLSLSTFITSTTTEPHSSTTADIFSSNPPFTKLPVVQFSLSIPTPSASATDAGFTSTPKSSPEESVRILLGVMFAVVFVSLSGIVACRGARRRERLKRGKMQQIQEQENYGQVSQTSSSQPRVRPQSRPWELEAYNGGRSVIELEGDEAYRAIELADIRHGS